MIIAMSVRVNAVFRIGAPFQVNAFKNVTKTLIVKHLKLMEKANVAFKGVALLRIYVTRG